mmetsp:Transcript_28523/g.64537  ORF Transcript_28523/g.64537 Transcript_28523/m.64537 type:complete len:158 (-) Transcript_28523:64-537(-)|eukprot:CAMPEP_0197905422 /NCGR_PEP_ID=MMETSP1439-20131203/60315_1 /TAXON_ID=66791 /ORGANISM="Gonyaulax spinifera, Strain CCMP409" /LENGTH=157 /DNA_ID=CAMNT_0043526699 /DNA_START=67 /DNA_END=540 /DNA_ORIENTATION=+
MARRGRQPRSPPHRRGRGTVLLAAALAAALVLALATAARGSTESFTAPRSSSTPVRSSAAATAAGWNSNFWSMGSQAQHKTGLKAGGSDGPEGKASETLVPVAVVTCLAVAAIPLVFGTDPTGLLLLAVLASVVSSVGYLVEEESLAKGIKGLFGKD